MKVAAMEGVWETSSNVPLLLFAWPDQENQTNRFEIGVPSLASFVLTHDWNGEVLGLNEVAVEEQPPVALIFWSFRVMVSLGLLMILFALTGLFLRRGDKFWRTTWFLQSLRVMTIAPFVAVLAGWFVTETGRSPWLVYGMLDYSAAITPSLTGGMALFTLIGYVMVYSMVFSAGVYYLMRVLFEGLEANHVKPEAQTERPKRPLSAVHTKFEIGKTNGRAVSQGAH